MMELTLSKDVSSNKHKTNSTKKHINKSRNESHSCKAEKKNIRQICKGFVLFIVIMRCSYCMMNRMTAPSMIYAFVRLNTILQISRISIIISKQVVSK